MARHTFGNLRLAMSRADCRDLKAMSHGQCACLVHEQCIASQNFLQASAAHRCDRLSISAIPLPHAACTAAGPRIAAWCTAMHRGGVHLLAQNANNDNVTNLPL